MMQQREIIAMIDAKRVGGIAQYEELDELAARFPYCSTFQVLRAIGLKERDSIDFKIQLNRASIAIQDRSKLYEYTVKQNLLTRILESQTEVEEVESEKVEETTTILTPTPVELSEIETPVAESSELVIEDKYKAELFEAKETELETVDSKEKHAAKDEPSDKFRTQVLEDEIMREAISQLGEIETEISLRELSAQPETTPAPISDSEKTIQDDEPLSFGRWLLKKSSSKEGQTGAAREIIDKFIQESPQISPVKTAFFSPSQMGKMSLVEDESFVTETLAKIYERQGDFKKAAKAYKNLKLKFPKKSIYFADLEKKAEDQIK